MSRERRCEKKNGSARNSNVVSVANDFFSQGFRRDSYRFQNLNANSHGTRRSRELAWSHWREPIFPWKHGLRELHTSRERHQHEGWCSLFIDNIPSAASTQDLWHMFNTVGVVVDVYISKKLRQNSSKRFGFVRFRREEEGFRAIKELHGRSLLGGTIKVSWARYKKGGSKTTPCRQLVEEGEKNKRISKPAFRDQKRYNEVVLGKKRLETRHEQEIQNRAKGIAVKVDKRASDTQTGIQNMESEGVRREGMQAQTQVILNLCENPTIRNILKLAAVVEFEPPMDCKMAASMLKSFDMPSLVCFSAISSLKMAVMFEDEAGLELAVEESSPLRTAFTNVCRWFDYEYMFERTVWLECVGLHPYCWSEENLMKIGEIWGKTIQVVNVFNGINSITSAKILVRTRNKRKIDKKVKIVAEYGSGEVWVKETKDCACLGLGSVVEHENVSDMEIDKGIEQEHGLSNKHDNGGRKDRLSVIPGLLTPMATRCDVGTKEGVNIHREEKDGLEWVSNSGEKEDPGLVNAAMEVSGIKHLLGLYEHESIILPSCHGIQGDVIVRTDVHDKLGYMEDQLQLVSKDNVWTENSFDPISSVEYAISLQMAEGNVVLSSPNLSNCSMIQPNSVPQKRPRGRPKRVVQSLPEPLLVPSTPSNSTLEAMETWDTAKRLGVKASNEGAVISALRKSKRLLVLEEMNPSG
ncbi:unnamed protein product [Amaranthus hypochondriacus]